MKSASAFENLPELERSNVIQVCMDEFATRGYQNASTNSIVKALSIPKGSIFYWFGTKDELYLYLVDLSVTRFVNDLASATQQWPNEILARLRIIIETSFRFLENNPNHFKLFMSFMNGEARHLLGPYLQEHWTEGLNIWANWYRGVDSSDFCSTQEEVEQLLMWMIAGIKVEMFAIVDAHDPVSSARIIFMKKLDLMVRLLARAIYNHPEKYGYS
jgi:AcrR family transcriptional regulator